MKAKILRAGIIICAINSLMSGALHAAQPSATGTTTPGSGFIDPSAPPPPNVVDSNTVPAYDMPPAYPDTPTSDNATQPSMPAGDSNVLPPPPPGMPYNGSSGVMPSDGTNNLNPGSMPPPNANGHPGMSGPGSLPPPPAGSGNLPGQNGGPATTNMLPPSQGSGTTSPGAKNTKTTKQKVSKAAQKPGAQAVN